MAKFRSRSAARQRAFQVLYSLQFTPVTSIDGLREVFERYPAEPDEKSDDSVLDAPAVADFAWELVAGVWTGAKELDQAISAQSHNWRVDRLGKVELTVLRLAFYELIKHTDVPPKVVISEALDLTSRFANVQARHFINGVLDAAVQAAATNAR
jgi:N utilization substance protein B